MHSLDIFGIVFSTCSPDSCAKTSSVFPKGQFFGSPFMITQFSPAMHLNAAAITPPRIFASTPHSEF